VALERKKSVQLQLQSIDQQRVQLQGEQDKLVVAEQRLTAKVEAFRTRKETIKAQYTAAEAQTKIGEAFTGVSEEMADVGMAIERAEDKTETMRARAGAIDELIESGALTDLSDGRDSIDRELEQITAASGVDAELEQLKAELGSGGPAPEQLGSGEAKG
jgi:phage shock protein A